MGGPHDVFARLYPSRSEVWLRAYVAHNSSFNAAVDNSIKAADRALAAFKEREDKGLFK